MKFLYQALNWFWTDCQKHLCEQHVQQHPQMVGGCCRLSIKCRTRNQVQAAYATLLATTKSVIAAASDFLWELLDMIMMMMMMQVEVRIREGRALNIHMFCARRPGLLLSTMRALDGLGLDVQQAVISCFNGFALDVFRAEARFSEHNFCLVVCFGDIYTWLLFIFSMSHASVSNFDMCIWFKPTIPFHHIYKLQEASSSYY